MRIPDRSRGSGLRLGGRLQAQNVGWAFIGQLVRAALNAALFILAARWLGLEMFGSFAATIALVALISPFGSMGTLSLLMRRVARSVDNVDTEFSSAIAITVGTGLFVSTGLGIVVSLGSVFAPWPVVVLLAIADLVAYRCAEVAGAARQAHDWILGTAFYPTIVVGARVAASALLATFCEPDLLNWSVAYAAASLVATLTLLAVTARVVGFAKPEPLSYLREWRDGLHFALGLSAQSAYNDIDKVMLAQFGSLGAVGAYAAAYRLVDLAFVPMRALLSASYIRFFRLGADGLAASATLAKRLVIPSLAASAIPSLGLLLAADFAPVLLGPEYEDAVTLVRLLALVPVLRAMHYLAADSLSGAGLQGIRTAVQIGVAIVNVSMNLVLIPAIGAHGAVISSLTSDALLAMLLWLGVRVRMRATTVEHGAG